MIPCGLNKKEQDDYVSLGYMLSANNIKLITKIQGISKYNALKDKLSTMIIHMAEDYLDVGVVYNHNIVKGYTIDLGVNSIAENIAKHIFNTKNIEVTVSVLNSIKKDMATILPNDNVEGNFVGYAK